MKLGLYARLHFSGHFERPKKWKQKKKREKKLCDKWSQEGEIFFRLYSETLCFQGADTVNGLAERKRKDWTKEEERGHLAQVKAGTSPSDGIPLVKIWLITFTFRVLLLTKFIQEKKESRGQSSITRANSGLCIRNLSK